MIDKEPRISTLVPHSEIELSAIEASALIGDDWRTLRLVADIRRLQSSLALQEKPWIYDPSDI